MGANTGGGVAGAPGHVPGSPVYRRVLLALGAAGVTTFSLLYYPQAILPLISRDLSISAPDAALTVSAATVGLAVAVLPWSWAADRIGRDRAMKIAVVAAALLGLVVPLAPGFEVLLALRIAQGAALGGIPALALTYLAEEVDARHAAAAAGSYISGTAAGGLVGRLVSAPVADLADWRMAALAVALLGVVGAAVMVLVLPAARRHPGATRGTASDPPRPRSVLRGLRAHLADPGLLVLYAQAFFLMGAYVAMYSYLVFRLEAPPFDLPLTLTALIFVAALAGTASARIAGTLAARHGRRPVLLGSVALMAVGAALTVPDWLPTVLAGLVEFTAAFFAAHAVASGWVGAAAPSGTAQAASLYSLFYYAGSSLFGWAVGLVVPFGWVAVAIALIALVLAALTAALTRPRSLRGAR